MRTHALKRKMLPAVIAVSMGLSLAAGVLYAEQGRSNPAAGVPERGTSQQGAAQQQPGTPGATPAPRATLPGTGAERVAANRDVRASELIGMTVVNAQNERLGEVNDIIVDVNNQRVNYAVLGFGGFAGIGEKLFAYPVQALQLGGEGDQLVLHVSKDALDASPGFERTAWPDWNRDDYRSRVDRHFGSTVRVEQRPNQRFVRASELIGGEVNDMKARKAGDVEDLVVNLRTGQVPYAVLELDTSWGTENLLVPVAISALDVAVDGSRDVELRVPREEIDVKSGFTDDAWPDLSNPANRPKVNGQGGRTG